MCTKEKIKKLRLVTTANSATFSNIIFFIKFPDLFNYEHTASTHSHVINNDVTNIITSAFDVGGSAGTKGTRQPLPMTIAGHRFFQYNFFHKIFNT